MRIIFPLSDGTTHFIAENVWFLLIMRGSELRALTPAAGVITPAIRPLRSKNAAVSISSQSDNLTYTPNSSSLGLAAIGLVSD